MKSKAAATLLATTILMAMPAAGEYVTAYEGLRVRSKPNTDSEIVRVLPFAEEVNGDVSDGWMRIEDGYVSCQYLQDSNPLDEYEYLGSWLMTAYSHSGRCCADESYPSAGYSVACNSLPFGTELFILGVGFRTVTDRGPTNMPSDWVDIFMDSIDECITWGERHCDLWIVKMP